MIPVAAFGVLVQRRRRSWWLLLPLAVTAWTLVHASGVHATVAGVLLAGTVPVSRRDGAAGPGLAEHFEHRSRPVSAGVAVPVFAFVAAGVTVGGLGGTGHRGLRHGHHRHRHRPGGRQSRGIFAATFLVARFTRASLADELGWVDVVGLALLGGIGFTVSLLIGELAYGAASERDHHVKVAVLAGSFLAATIAAVILRARNRTYRRIQEAEEADTD